MDLGLTGKTVLITGASSGIGAATAGVFAAEGAHLVLVARNKERLAKTEAAAFPHGVRVQTVSVDLSVGSAILSLAEQFADVDVVVNNAGAVPGGSLFDLDETAWREGWNSKVFPYINMCRAFYLSMKQRGGGTIVNVLGNGSVVKRPNYMCGGMANAALDFLTETLGGRSAEDNIRVVGVRPGPVDTPRYRDIARQRGTDMPKLLAGMPFGRIASAEELGGVIAMAASDRLGYMSGAIITVDAGLSVGTRQ
jgi:NAD(P)-dependent dehydrogenase (short-subunit alcohol dehydrogenase family)